MSIATEISRLQQAKADIKTSIEAKGVSVPSTTTIDGYSALIDQIPQGEDEELKDVMFFDYDGTPLYQYTKEEFALLESLPPNPTHAGLTAQGWNWTLADAKTYVATYGMLDIGQTYITDDGKTRLYITIDDSNYKSPTLFWYQTISEGVEIDWGDGSGIEKVAGNGNKSLTHIYGSIGRYVIKMNPVSGTFNLGQNSATNCIICGIDESRNKYIGLLTNVELGSSVYMSSSCFSNNYNLKTITIYSITNLPTYVFAGCLSLKAAMLPSGCAQLVTNTFFGCTNLKHVSIPKSVTTFSGGSVFTGCSVLKRICLTEGMTTLSGGYFQSCSNIEQIVLPNGITSIQSSALNGCQSLKNIIFPGSITDISSSGLSNCMRLFDIEIPANVTALGSSAFQSNRCLTTVKVRSNPIIGANCFNACSIMKRYYFYSTTPPVLAGTNVFAGNSSDFVIYVPSSAVNDYKEAQYWSTYAGRIEAMPE